MNVVLAWINLCAVFSLYVFSLAVVLLSCISLAVFSLGSFPYHGCICIAVFSLDAFHVFPNWGCDARCILSNIWATATSACWLLSYTYTTNTCKMYQFIFHTLAWMYFWCTLHPHQYQSRRNLWCSPAFMIHQRLYSRDCKARKLSEIGLCGGPISTWRVSCPLWLGRPKANFSTATFGKSCTFRVQKGGT